MITDLSDFSEENFDPKSWVNTSCNSKPEDESVDKHLSEMEMKLQLLAEDIASSLEELSSNSLLRIPRAVRETNRVRDDASSLRQTVAGILQRLNQVEGSSAQSVATLSRIDTVKQRMEAARDTLQDAAGLAQLRASVEDVFASGDLPRVAETLSSMRKCLSVVGEVPEFADMKRQLAGLEDRLEQMVQPRLADAISQKKVEETQSLQEILVAIGRLTALEEQYIRVRLRPIKKLWDDYNTASPPLPLSDWLHRFYDKVLLLVDEEVQWCQLVFPFLSAIRAGEKAEGNQDQEVKVGAVLVPHLLTQSMAAIASSFMDSLDQAVQGKEGIVLTRLISLHSVSASFASSVSRLLLPTLPAGYSLPSPLPAVVLSVVSPFENYKQRYAQLEQGLLANEITGLDLQPCNSRSTGGRGVEMAEAVKRMEASIPTILACLEASLERCLSFTGGSEAGALLLALDHSLLTYLAGLERILESLRPLCGLAAPDASQSASAAWSSVVEEEEWALVQGALQVLAVAEALVGRVQLLEASLKAGVAKMLSDHVLGEQADVSLNPAVLRLAEAPEKRQRLVSLQAECVEPAWHPLSQAWQRVESFQESVSSLVHAVLIGKVQRALVGVAAMPVWSAQEESNVFDLPSFSAYPETYVTVMGEYLLQLPQQLETLVPEEGAEEDQGFFAADWMFRVAEGATALYLEQLKGIAVLSEKGGRQLAADLEYFCNVLAALSMGTPPALATFQECLSASKEGMAEMVSAAEAGEAQWDVATVKLVAKMRRIALQ